MGMSNRSQWAREMNESFDRPAGQRKRPATGWEQTAQGGGKALSRMARRTARADSTVCFRLLGTAVCDTDIHLRYRAAAALSSAETARGRETIASWPKDRIPPVR